MFNPRARDIILYILYDDIIYHFQDNASTSYTLQFYTNTSFSEEDYEPWLKDLHVIGRSWARKDVV